MSKLTVVAWALTAGTLFGIAPPAAERAGRVAADQQAHPRLRQAAEGAERDPGKEPPPSSNPSSDGRFYFGPVTVTVMPPGYLAAQKELVFWESIKASGDPRDFEDFLKHFPDSEFASLARRKVAALRPPAAAAAPADGDPSSTIGERRALQP